MKSRRFAFVINDSTSGFEKILELAHDNVDVVGIDEVQFFSAPVLALLTSLYDGKLVIVAGLDLDFRGEPFGVMPTLMAVSRSFETQSNLRTIQDRTHIIHNASSMESLLHMMIQ